MSCEEYEELLNNSLESSTDDVIEKLRQMILEHGIPDIVGVWHSSLASYLFNSHKIENDRPDGLRCRIWKILLRIPHVDADEYLRLVQRKESRNYDSIRSDTFRIFGKDYKFKERVAEAKLIRVLNAFTHYCQDAHIPINYLQSMTKLLAPFLYVMPEVDAYFCFRRFTLCCCPAYVEPHLVGAYQGLAVYLLSHPNNLHSFILDFWRSFETGWSRIIYHSEREALRSSSRPNVSFDTFSPRYLPVSLL